MDSARVTRVEDHLIVSLCAWVENSCRRLMEAHKQLAGPGTAGNAGCSGEQ